MAKQVCKCGIKRKKGYLYFVDKKGNVSCAKMSRGGKKKKKKRRRKGFFTYRALFVKIINYYLNSFSRAL